MLGVLCLLTRSPHLLCVWGWAVHSFHVMQWCHKAVPRVFTQGSQLGFHHWPVSPPRLPITEPTVAQNKNLKHSCTRGFFSNDPPMVAHRLLWSRLAYMLPRRYKHLRISPLLTWTPPPRKQPVPEGKSEIIGNTDLGRTKTKNQFSHWLSSLIVRKQLHAMISNSFFLTTSYSVRCEIEKTSQQMEDGFADRETL